MGQTKSYMINGNKYNGIQRTGLPQTNIDNHMLFIVSFIEFHIKFL